MSADFFIVFFYLNSISLWVYVSYTKGIYVMRRVVITGMGIVSPVGTGVEHAWKNILAGKSGVRKVDSFEVEDLASQIAGVPEVGTEPGQYNPDSVVDAREQRKLDKCEIYGIVAADEPSKMLGWIHTKVIKPA